MGGEGKNDLSVSHFTGRWLEDKSRGDVAHLNEFLTACDWGWATRQILCSAPNQIWAIEQPGPAKLKMGVEANALTKKLVGLVGAKPSVEYDCSGAEFSFELFTGVVAKAHCSWEDDGTLALTMSITAPAYIIDCVWTYRLVQVQDTEPIVIATCKEDYTPSFDGAIPMNQGEPCRILGEVGADWTKVCIVQHSEETIGYVPTSFLSFAAMESARPAAPNGLKAANTPAPSIESDEARPQELRCDQINKVFKREGDSKGPPVPELDHSIQQVWVRADTRKRGLFGHLSQ